ncbi:MAG: hypothetical protein ACKOC5_08140 [Chloroflexota bacterium]
MRARYRDDLRAMVDHLFNAACIAVWVPFNEGWGQFEARSVAEALKCWDPSRLVDHASGWFDQGAGDFHSLHIYCRGLDSHTPDPRRAYVISEFGGYSLEVKGHVWNPQKEFGYQVYPTADKLTEAYLRLVETEVLPMIGRGLAAAIYTQTSDVEEEINGFLSYDRRVEKMDPACLRMVHQALIASL